MDRKHLVTAEGARESLIAISYGVNIDEIAYSPETDDAGGITDGEISITVTGDRKKTIDELRSELISLASFEPSTDCKIDRSTALKV